MATGTKQKKSEALSWRLARWLRKSLLQGWQPLGKSMTEPNKERPLSEYKEMLDAGTLKLLTPEESAQRASEIRELIEEGRKRLQSRPPNPT